MALLKGLGGGCRQRWAPCSGASRARSAPHPQQGHCPPREEPGRADPAGNATRGPLGQRNAAHPGAGSWPSRGARTPSIIQTGDLARGDPAAAGLMEIQRGKRSSLGLQRCSGGLHSAPHPTPACLTSNKSSTAWRSLISKPEQHLAPIRNVHLEIQCE